MPPAKHALGLSALLSLAALACGGESSPPKTPDAPPPPTDTTAATPSTAAATNAGQAQVDSGVPPLQGKFGSATRAANSGKEDKIGETDGSFKPDGVKDLVFDIEITGQVASFIVAACDADGTPTGEWDADSLAGKEIFPGEILPNRDPHDVNAGIGIYENGKLLNKPNGGIDVMSDGTRKLQLRISSKKAKGGPVRVFAMLADRSIVTGPVIPAAGK